MHSVARAASVVGAAGALGLAYASLVERNAYVLRRWDVPVLPAGSRPLTVVHLSDLHLMPGQRRKAAWVSALAQLEPDLFVNTGNNISHPDSIAVALEAFSAVAGVPGVFVLGSNDYF
jgi:predicted MPP superfamily phosphohydrolase